MKSRILYSSVRRAMIFRAMRIMRCPKGGIKINSETKKESLREFIRNRKTHAIEFMKENYGMDEAASNEAYELAVKSGRYAFVIFLLLGILGGIFEGNFGVLHTLEVAITSFLWALLFYVIVIIMGKHSLELEKEAKGVWQKIK